MADSSDAKKLLKKLGSEPVRRSKDRFEAKDRPNVPERSKPTAAEKRQAQPEHQKGAGRMAEDAQ